MKKFGLSFLLLLILSGCSIQKIQQAITTIKPETKNQVTLENTIIPDDANISFVSPVAGSQNINGKTPLTFLWKNPMFPLGSETISPEFINQFITLNPTHEGNWKVLGTTGLSFEPKENWPLETRYEVKISPTLAPDFEYYFETAPITILIGSTDNLINKNQLNIQLNQDFELTAISPRLNLVEVNSGKKILFDLAHSITKQAGQPDIIAKNNLRLTPREPWQEETTYQLTLQSLKNISENFPTIEQTFTTPGPFVTRITPPIYHNQPIGIVFSSNINGADLLDNITLTPSLETAAWKKYKDNLRQNYQYNALNQNNFFELPSPQKIWSPEQTYSIQINNKLKDINGRTLSSDSERNTATFTTVFENQFRPVFIHKPNSTFAPDTPLYFSFLHTGDFSNAIITLNDKLKNYPLNNSRKKQQIWDGDLKKEFPSIINEDGTIKNGFYKLDIHANPSDQEKQHPISYRHDFFVSDFSVTIKELPNKTYQVFANAYPQDEAIPENFDVDVFVGNWENQWLYKTFENVQNGFTFTLSEQESYLKSVAVKTKQKTGYGSTSFNNGIDIWNSKASYEPWQYQKTNTGTLFTDRPLYKTGDTVFFKGFIRGLNLKGKNFPLEDARDQSIPYQIKIFNPTYDEIKIIKGNTQSDSFNGQFVIPNDGTLGEYQINFELLESNQVQPLQITVPFWVEAYRKPNFLIEAQFDASQALPEETITATIKAEYAFGGGLAHKKIQYNVVLFGHEPCQYWCWFRNTKDQVLTSGEGVLDQNGEFQIPLSLQNLDLKNIDWKLLTLNATVEAHDAESSSVEQSIPFYPSEKKIELMPVPYFFADTNPAKITGTITDIQTKEISPQQALTLTLLKRKWVRNDRKNMDGNFYGEWESLDEILKTNDTKTDKLGQFYFDFTPPTESGEYAIIIETNDSKKRTAKQRHDFWVAGQTMTYAKQNDNNKILWLFADQDAYNIGETVQIFAPNPEFKITRVQATIERGEVIETLPFDRETNTVEFVAEDWMAPNIFVSVLLEGIDPDGNPKIKWGVEKININNPQNQLDITVTPKKGIYKPGEEVTLTIKTKVQNQAQPAEVSIAVVDQTLLALKARVKVDLIESLIGHLPLGVQTFHTLANFMSKTEIEDLIKDAQSVKNRIEIGFGGGGGKGSEFKPRGDFRDTAVFLDTVLTDKNGQATVRFKLPDNATTWNIFAAGATQKNAFGTHTSNFKTSLPIVITEILPNFFQAGDRLEVGALIRRNEKNITQTPLTITLEVPTELVIDGKKTQTVTVENEAIVYFPVQVESVSKAQNITLKFSVLNEKNLEQDVIVIERELLPINQTVVMADLLHVTSDTKLTIRPNPKAVTSDMNLKIFASLSNSLETLVDQTNRLNYGCTEQRLSALTAQMMQAELVSSLTQKNSVMDVKALQENRTFIEQAFFNDGGFGFWDTNSGPNVWVTTQILEHADLWKKFGAPFDPQKLTTSATWLREKILEPCNDQNQNCLDNTTRLHAAYVLAAYNQVGVDDLQFLDTFTTSLEAKAWWLKTAQAITKLSPTISTLAQQKQDLIQNALVVSDRHAFWSENEQTFYSQDERLTAILFETLLESNTLTTQYPKIARYLAESQKNSLSGNSAMRVLKALALYTKSQETASLSAEFEVTNKTVNETLLKGNLQTLQQIQTVTKDYEGQPNQTISITSTKPILAEISLTEQIPAQELAAISRGFWIQREVFVANDSDPKKVDELKVGTNYQVTLKIINNHPQRQVMIEDPIPSGAEIINLNLNNSHQQLAELTTPACEWGWCAPIFQHAEYQYDRARFFVDYLPAGTHEITYLLQTRLTGEFDWLPAKIESMYFPEVFANTAGQRIKIINKK